MSLKHKVVATGTNDGGKQVSLDAWNDEHVVDETKPSAPSAGVGLYAMVRAGRRFLAPLDAGGFAAPLAAHPAFGARASWLFPAGSANNATVFGMAAGTALGTATVRTQASGSLVSRMHRQGYVSSATAGNFAGYYFTTANKLMSSGGGYDFLLFVGRFAVSDAATVSGARMFVGLSSSTAAPTNVEPNTLVNSIGVAQLSGSNNLQLVYGGSSAQTAIDLGSDFPANTLSADAYEVALWSPPAEANKVYYEVKRLGTSYVASGTLTATTSGVELPSPSTPLCMRAWRTNNATALAVGLDVGLLYIETEG